MMSAVLKPIAPAFSPEKYDSAKPILCGTYLIDMPNDTYHAHDSISATGLKRIERSAAHFMYPPERQETRNKVLGSALHMACLEPDLFYKTYHLLRGAKDRVCNEYKEAKLEYGETRVLVASEVERVEGIMNALYRDTEIRRLLEYAGYSELSGFSVDEKTGAVCRHRFDRLTKDFVAIDLKTTIDARTRAFSRAILNYGYHVQNAFYEDQFKWITGGTLSGFFFVAVESESPYACKLYWLDDDSLKLGRETYRKNLDLYAYCKSVDEWPAYNTEPSSIGVPNWALNSDDSGLIDNMTFNEE